MHKVLAQTLAKTTQSTIVAVVDAACRLVVPQFTNVAIVASSDLTTVAAAGRRGLSAATKHAEHMFRLSSN